MVAGSCMRMELLRSSSADVLEVGGRKAGGCLRIDICDSDVHTRTASQERSHQYRPQTVAARLKVVQLARMQDVAMDRYRIQLHPICLVFPILITHGMLRRIFKFALVWKRSW